MPRLSCHGDASLVALGLGRGGAVLDYDGETIALTSPAGTRFVLAVGEIDRVRFGYEASKFIGVVYQVIVWTAAAPRPLLLRAAHGQDGDYAAFARDLAAEVARRRGIGAVERGLGWGAALAEPLFFLPFVLVGAGTLVLLLRESAPLALLLALAGVILLVVATFAFQYLRANRPRPVADLAELAPVLPEAAG